MVRKASNLSFPVITLDKRIVNEPALVLVGYITLAIMLLSASRSPLQVGLALLLAILGSGISTVTVFYPRSQDIDLVERLALSACLSIAIGGMSGFALTRSDWGLQLWPFLIITGLYNIICYFLTWFQQRNLGEDQRFYRLDVQKLMLSWKAEQSSSSRLLTSFLIICLISGIWVFAQNLRTPAMDPPMTEFYLLDQNGQTQEYPKTGRVGEAMKIAYGIVNRENALTSYQVKVYIQGEEVRITRPIILDSGETQISQIEFQLMDTLSDQTKVEFVLYREEKPYRFLHLWINAVGP